jgi:hypothetical protein
VIPREEIQHFLDRLAKEGASWSEVEPDIWVLKPGDEIDFDIVVNYAPPVVVLRVKVMDLPKDSPELLELYGRLLKWNANDLLHGSYGIQGDAIVLTEALELSHLDYEEFLASYESITLSLSSHLRELAAYREGR